MTNGRYIDIENECLRSRLADCKAGAQALINAVERYTRGECLRSELLNIKETLKTKLR